jgi:hypothetical protein
MRSYASGPRIQNASPPKIALTPMMSNRRATGRLNRHPAWQTAFEPVKRVVERVDPQDVHIVRHWFTLHGEHAPPR